VSQITSIFHPSSPEAQSIYNLTIWIIALCGCIFALVAGLVTFACIRFRARAGSPEPEPNYGNTWLEISWTSGLLLILAVVMFFTVKTMIESSPSDFGLKPDLIVVGHQWWWEIRYPTDAGEAITANEIHIPVGQRLLLELRAADVIHDFWVPELGRKIDAIPGHPNQIWLHAENEGEFQGFCAEFCGASHAWMKIRVIAENHSEFDRWLSHMKESAQIPTSEAAKRGLAIFQNKTCVNCHRISGPTNGDPIGPDLTHLSSRETLGAGALQNTKFNLARWLENPDAIKPGAHMPSFGLTKSEIDDLTSYFEGLL